MEGLNPDTLSRIRFAVFMMTYSASAAAAAYFLFIRSFMFFVNNISKRFGSRAMKAGCRVRTASKLCSKVILGVIGLVYFFDVVRRAVLVILGAGSVCKRSAVYQAVK